MALVDLSLHCHLSRVCPKVEVLTYVDNWELQARQVPSLIASHQALVEFTRPWDLNLHESKTLMWGTARQDRWALRALGHAVCLDVRDLGGHAQFSSRAFNLMVVERLQRQQALWPRLRASFSSHRHKRAALPVAAWPRGLHGIAGVAVGSQHFDRLRAGAMVGLSLDRPGASSLIHLSLLSFPLSGPGFFAVRATVLEFRVSA